MTNHDGHRHGPVQDGQSGQWRLAVTLLLTGSYCIVELVGGWYTNSLALISDAGHMFADVAALGASMLAAYLAQRPADPSKTFGYHRAEILTAFVSGLALWVMVLLIFEEAYQRISNPQPVQSGVMIAIAAVGLAVNVAGLLVLRPAHDGNLNMRSAFVHVLGDALGSVGAIIGGVLMLSAGWYIADPLISALIGLLILYSSWGIVRESVEILMQGAPRQMPLQSVEECLRAITGVTEVHDLHVWTLTSGRYLLSVHLVVCVDTPPQAVIDSAQRALKERFGIAHATVQIDHEAACAEELRAH